MMNSLLIWVMAGKHFMVFFAAVKLITMVLLGVSLLCRLFECFKSPNAKSVINIVLIVILSFSIYYLSKFIPKYHFYHPEQIWVLYCGWAGYALLLVLSVLMAFRGQDGMLRLQNRLTAEQIQAQELEAQLDEVKLNFWQGCLIIVIYMACAFFTVYLNFSFPKNWYKKNHPQHIMQIQKHHYQNITLQPSYGNKGSNAITGVTIHTKDSKFYAKVLQGIPLDGLFASGGKGRFYFVEAQVKDIHFTTFDHNKYSAVIEAVTLSDRTYVSSPQALNEYIKQLDRYEYVPSWGMSYYLILNVFGILFWLGLVIKVDRYFKVSNLRKQVLGSEN